MLGIASTATDNIIEKYKARFHTEAGTSNILFRENEKALPARLSPEQHQAYVSEFESFIATSKRKLFRHAILMILLFILVAIAAIYFFEIDVIERYETHATAAFMFCWTLPLAFIFRDGKRLFDKPASELQPLPEGVIQPLTKTQITDQRIMGMSYGFIGLMGLIAIAGIVLNLPQQLPKTLKDLDFLLYGLLLLAAIYLWFRKSRAHRRQHPP